MTFTTSTNTTAGSLTIVTSEKRTAAPVLPEREVRYFTVAPVELREDGGTGLTLVGLASATETPYTVFGGPPMGFNETMAKGAFKRSLKARDDVKLKINHEGIPLARTKSGTLKLSEDDEGLRVEAGLDGDNPAVAELSSAMRRGDIDQMSIAFRAVRQEWDDEYTERRVVEAQLFDVSVVADPASPTTSASLRADELVRRLTDLEPDALVEARSAHPEWAPVIDAVAEARALLRSAPSPARNRLRLARALAESITA